MRAVFETENVTLGGSSPEVVFFGVSTLPQVTVPGSAGPFTFSHTAPGAGLDSLLVVFVIQRNSVVGGDSTVLFNGVSMGSPVATVGSADTFRVEGYAKVAPATGAHNVSVTCIGSPSFMGAFAISFTGVDQVSPIAGSNNASSDTPASPINTVITVPAGGYAVDGTYINLGGVTATIQNVATEILNAADDFAAFGRVLGGYKANATQMGWAFSGSPSHYRQLILAINPAATGGGSGGSGDVYETEALPDSTTDTGTLIPQVHMVSGQNAYEIYDRGSGIDLVPRAIMVGVGHGGTLGLGTGALVPHPLLNSSLAYNTNAITVSTSDNVTLGDQQDTQSVQNETVVESMVLGDESAEGAVLTADQQEVITILDVRDVSFSTDLQRSDQFIISDSQDCTVDPAPNSVNMVEPVGFADYSDVDVIGAPAEGRTVALPASTHNPRTVTHVFKPSKQSDEQDYFGFDFTKVLSFGEEIRTMPGYAPVVQMQLRRGTDPLPEDMITGMPVFVAGPLVYLKVVGGLNRNDYMLSVEINTNKGRRLPAYGVIRVRDPRVH
jgi:hypothetical protein